MELPKRYLGLELAGAKNQKTSLAALEYYPKEKKLFLLDIFDKITAHEEQSGDEALLEVIREVSLDGSKMGVNVALELPPCTTCTRKTCPLPASCTVPAVQWMREFSEKENLHTKSLRSKEFTPYTQRPIELWVRHQILPTLKEGGFFEVDETLGGNKAPLSARMNFLKRHLQGMSLVEVWPKLSIALLTEQFGIDRKIVATYRTLEDGAPAREVILQSLTQISQVFIYERDLRKLALNLTAFDAFFCAFTAFLSDNQLCTHIPPGFPLSSGWIQYPKPYRPILTPC